MKKGIAFLLAAVMCLGFVGCGKEITAETVFDALSKKGKLVFEIKYDSMVSDNSAQEPNVEMIVFRLPKEQRPTPGEDACYIEVYPSREALERSAEQYKQIKKIDWLYASKNVLLRIDGNVPFDIVQPYTDALKKLTNEEVQARHRAEPIIRSSNREKTFQLPGNFGANEAFEILKQEIGGLEFASYVYTANAEIVSFWLRESGNIFCGSVLVFESYKEAVSFAEIGYSPNPWAGIACSIFVSDNVVIEIDRSSEALFIQYSNALKKITGKPIDMEFSKRSE
jgi:hypothetical protein